MKNLISKMALNSILVTMLLLFFSVSIVGAEKTKLTIVTDDWPPYEFKTGEPGNESITGFSTEVIMAILNKMNIGINDSIKQHPWVRAEKMLLAGDADLLYTAASNEDREKETYYAYEPLIDSSWSFFIRKEDEGKIKYDSLDDFKGKKIGVVRGYSYTKEFWDYVKKEQSFEEVVSDDLNVKKLAGKRFDIILIDYVNGVSLLKKMNLADKVIALPNPLKKVSLYAVFSKKTVEKSFVDKFSEELKAFKATEGYKAIYDKYIEK